jgi:hypothetical protein
LYLDEIKGLSDEMAAAGKPLDNLDVISHILLGLDEEYVVSQARSSSLKLPWNVFLAIPVITPFCAFLGAPVG